LIAGHRAFVRPAKNAGLKNQAMRHSGGLGFWQGARRDIGSIASHRLTSPFEFGSATARQRFSLRRSQNGPFFLLSLADMPSEPTDNTTPALLQNCSIATNFATLSPRISPADLLKPAGRAACGSINKGQKTSQGSLFGFLSPQASLCGFLHAYSIFI